VRKTKNIQKVPFPAPDVVTKVVPAPTDGWDAISPLANMDPKRAPILDNWIPRTGWVELRAGCSPWAGLPAIFDPIETLMVWRGGTGTERMFAATPDSIWDVSFFGSPSETLTGFSSGRWQYINFTPSGGTTVIQCVNGLDSLRQFDGTNWTTPTITGFNGGLTTAAIRSIWAQKRRLWYIMGDGVGGGSTQVAFMPTDAISGAIAGTLDLGATWTKGGYCVGMSNWTIDSAGTGPQDFALFVSSRGQMTIYSGTDPTNSNAWSLVGTFDIAPPIGLRCMTKIGSDVGIITQQGVLPVSQALPFDPSADRSVAITARIQNAMADAAMAYGTNFGWQLIAVPNEQLGIVNVPVIENNTQVQLVMNVLTGAWCRITGWNANCFEIFNNELYFGGNTGEVCKAFDSGLDLLEPIMADMQCAFNYFDDPGRNKRVTMVQPFLVAGGTVTPTIGMDVDFLASTAVSTIQILSGGALWDQAIWDTSEWAGGTQVINNWLSVQAMGHALAVRMTVNIVTTSGSVATGGMFDMGIFDTAQFDQNVSTLAPILQVNAFNCILEMGGFV